jgi:benzoyl-CoA reductase/2-hydroxyglutaryl-CoA dehydratase subunit BcrC/BadD/HgdB
MNDSAQKPAKIPTIFASLFEAAAAAAGTWRAATGGKIVGYLGSDMPVEIIIAAGCLPFRIGAFEPKTTAVQRFLEMGDSNVVAQLADALLDGSYDFLDHIVIGNSPTFNITLFHFLRESRRLDPCFPAPTMTFHEIHHGEGKTIEDFNLDSCRRLAERLSTLGSPINDVMLRTAIDQTNARRGELARLQALRRHASVGLSGTDALALVAQWQLMPQVPLREPALLPRRVPRVMFSGSDVGHFQHYPLIEATGCTIVADDHDWGEDSLLPTIERADDPMRAIAVRYAQQTPRASRFSSKRRIADIVQRALGANVEGVVLWISDEDQASSWDVPELTAALGLHGIATLDLGPQPVIGFDEVAIAAKLRRWLYTLRAEPTIESGAESRAEVAQ